MERRQFLKTGLAAPFLQSARAAGDAVRIGIIGLGTRGSYELNVCSRLKDAKVLAVADVFQPMVDKTLEAANHAFDGYQDFRRILDRKDIDAVFVSTPDHWHAPITILACQAGKDVYCEKPVSHTIAEGRSMVNAARMHNRVVAVGSQQRSAPHFAKCAELVQSGYIGDVSAIDCWIVSNEYPQGAGKLADSVPPAG